MKRRRKPPNKVVTLSQRHHPSRPFRQTTPHLAEKCGSLGRAGRLVNDDLGCLVLQRLERRAHTPQFVLEAAAVVMRHRLGRCVYSVVKARTAAATTACHWLHYFSFNPSNPRTLFFPVCVCPCSSFCFPRVELWLPLQPVNSGSDLRDYGSIQISIMYSDDYVAQG